MKVPPLIDSRFEKIRFESEFELTDLFCWNSIQMILKEKKSDQLKIENHF